MDDKTTSAGLEATEAECAAGRTAPRVSLADIEANIAYQVSFVAQDAIASLRRADDTPAAPLLVGTTLQPTPESLDVLTIHLLVLRNGFTIIGKSAPASVANFDAELGRKLAYEDAVRQAWPLMGYALRERLSASEGGPRTGTRIREVEPGDDPPQDAQPTRLAQSAVEDGNVCGRPSDADLRIIALEQANSRTGYSDQIVDRAAAYLAFLRGEQEAAR